MKKKNKNDLIRKRMEYYQQCKHKCPKCDFKVAIPYDKESKICRYCGTRVFKDEEEYKKYYFKQQMRRVMVKNENNERNISI